MIRTQSSLQLCSRKPGIAMKQGWIFSFQQLSTRRTGTLPSKASTTSGQEHCPAKHPPKAACAWEDVRHQGDADSACVQNYYNTHRSEKPAGQPGKRQRSFSLSSMKETSPFSDQRCNCFQVNSKAGNGVEGRGEDTILNRT